jgi:uncharacterized membrane protein
MKVIKRLFSALWVIPIFFLVSCIWIIIVIPMWIVTGKDKITPAVNNIFDDLILFMDEL